MIELAFDDVSKRDVTRRKSIAELAARKWLGKLWTRRTPLEAPVAGLRVSIVTEPAAWGGMEVHSINLARALAARGHRITIVAIGRGVYETHTASSERVTIRPIDVPDGLWDLSVDEWRRLLGPFSGDVCILAKNCWGQGGTRFNIAARSLFGRVFYIEHAGPELTPPQQRPRQGWRHFIPRTGWWQLRSSMRGRLHTAWVSRVICVSNHVQDVLHRETGFPSTKLATIRNGVDPMRFIPDPIARATRHNEWGIPDSAIVCGSVTRLENHSKQLDLLLRAFADVRHRRPDLPLWCVLVGDGPDRQELIDLSIALGITDRFRIASFTTQPWLAYPGLDIFSITSRSEAISLALMEAMACGCYAIGGRVGGIPEVLGNTGVGELVAANDELAFADALLAAATLPGSERAAVGRRARNLICERFDSSVAFARIAELIESGSP